ncbi:MAG: hypothetical protein AVDCRST_MAG93-1796 [uncultured Chloroflexia bacterium]|uniref:Rhodanese domain-containing protein n=1 Tax=uncultured Chloroflexia bacterium TaxID=1672391 RepID=A0A6J4IHK9_9CHLR|nr:MAG: hypothetical protein AVDCRST_MAG93-1796 [uncultured Chloroflexia bacterium]
MLLAFVLFGAVLSSLLPTLPFVPILLFALIVIVLVRPIALGLVLRKAMMSNTARAFIGWFGPRGLSSLLLVLLAVQADVPNAEYLLAITGMVVVFSVVLHGASATPLASWYGRRVAQSQRTLAEEREATATGLFQQEAKDIQRITPAELAAQLAGPNPPVVLDVRSRAHFERDDGQIPGSVRVLPDHVEEWAGKALRDRSVVAYCT